MKSGKIVPGMNLKQVYLASGEMANGFKTLSIWMVFENGTLTFPPTVILPDIPVVLIMKNKTRFDTVTEEEFRVYMDNMGRVSKSKEITHKIDMV